MLDRVLLKNISSLFGIKLAGYIIPLITLPYLVRVLGVEAYGYLGFSTAITQYFILFVNYGFDLSATSNIAKKGENIKYVSMIFWNIITIRLTFSMLGLLLIYILTYYSDLLTDSKNILFACYAAVFGAAIFPQWLFQGKEQLGLISVLRICLQFATIPMLLLFVKDESNVFQAALIGAIPSVGISFISILVISRRNWICWMRPTWKGIKIECLDGFPIFVSTAAVSLYTTSVTVLLGVISGPTSVGYFSAADKLIKSVLGLFSPISSAFYPRINAAVSRNKNEAIILIKKLFKLQISISLATSILIFFMSEWITIFLFGYEFMKSANILKILALVPFLISISNIYGIQTLLPFGYAKLFSKILIQSGCVSIFILIVLTTMFSEYGAAISVLVTEFIVTILMWFAVKKKNILNSVE